MLIEHRVYTLKLGSTELFWDAQSERGNDGLKPILDRLIGAFATRCGPADEIVSLYRYDSFDDWHTRLLGLYGQAALQPYFNIVRPLIVRQESKFLVPAPLPELTPHWGNGRDWLPGHAPRFTALHGVSHGACIVEETTLSFAAGGVSACWAAFRQHGLVDDTAAMSGLFGAFSTLVGALNQVLLYRCFANAEAWSAHRAALRASTCWSGFLRTLAPLTVGSASRLLEPSRIADMSPMFM